MTRTTAGIIAAVAAALVLGACSAETETADPAASGTTASGAAASATTKAAAPKATTKPQPAAPALTKEQANAKNTALSYLDLSGFSMSGLIKQLESEGFSAKDAEAALATMKVDWNAEAAESAKAYQDMTPMSAAGLIKQLKLEGYTTEQAEFGAKAAGL